MPKLPNILFLNRDLLIAPDMESKIRSTALITVLLNGPVDVGNTFVGRQGIIQMILVMANSDSYLEQVNLSIYL